MDPRKNTQKRVAMLLGVAQQTVSDWWKPATTNTDSGNGCVTERPDARVRVPVAEYAKIGFLLAARGMTSMSIIAP